MFGVCPETKRCAGMERQRKAEDGPLSCRGGGGGEKYIVIFFLLTFSRLQENRVGHDIFNLHCQNVSRPEQSRYISLGGGKRRVFLLIKRTDDGGAAAAAAAGAQGGGRGSGA